MGKKQQNFRKIPRSFNCVNFAQTCGKYSLFHRVEFTHAFFKLSGTIGRIFTKLYEELVSHYFSYLIAF